MQNMYNQQSTYMNIPQQTAMNQPSPVTRAVADNISGKLAAKKSLVRCYDCNLDFTSQIVLDAHLQGARHAKQVRSKNIMATLEQTDIAFSKDEVTNGLKCNPCNVLLNSIQQLQTHLNGNRHKKKLAKGDWSGKEIVSKSNVMASQQKSLSAAAIKLLPCEPCNKFFNSQSQLDVHLASQKHSDKINNITVKNPKKKRYFPYWKKDEGVYSTTTMPATQALSSNFVSAGYQQHGY